MKDVEVVTETERSDSFDIVVIEKSIGSLETNIGAVEEFAEERLKDYLPENYMGDSDLAKKDRAELNKAAEVIRKTRIAIMEEVTKPFQEFEDRCKALERKIGDASKSLDEIVKAKESEEKQKKRELVEDIWKSKNFDLFALDKIFNPKWLNKTYKESEIGKDIDSIIERTYNDLKMLERCVDQEDVETLKAHYLMNLDITETMAYGDELKKAKEVAQKEKEERSEREHQQAVVSQQRELVREALELEREESVSGVVDEALGETTKPTRKEFVVSIKCFDEDLLKLKSAMNALGIEYSVEELDF